jgi:hypothetical protein
MTPCGSRDRVDLGFAVCRSFSAYAATRGANAYCS